MNKTNRSYQKHIEHRRAAGLVKAARDRSGRVRRTQEWRKRFSTHKANLREYFERTGDVYYHHDTRVRAAMRRATPANYDVEPIRELYRQCIEWNDRSPGIEYHIDHIIPVCGRIVCGLHVHWNMRIVTKSFQEVTIFDRKAEEDRHLEWLHQQGLA